jgi:hypothetical protein
MNFSTFKPLRDALRNETFTREQLGQLLEVITGRICRCEEPEFKLVQQDLCDACDAYESAVREIDEREARLEHDHYEGEKA